MRTILLTTLLIVSHLVTVAQLADDRLVSYTTTPDAIALYWKDANGQPLKSLQNLKQNIGKQGKTLVFGMNAGMYRPDNSPQGLFIDHGTIRQRLDTLSGGGNFYMKPNGVFYTTTRHHAGVCTTPQFIPHDTITFATQSGPMLLIDGAIHPAFKKGSANLNIRNGVGILRRARALCHVERAGELL
nr:phosphodiester glycosidase family protein [Dawidia soli]